MPLEATPEQITRLRALIKEHRASYRTTWLSPAEETRFQRWIVTTPWYQNFVKTTGQKPTLDDPDYDYRGVFKFGGDLSRKHGSSRLPTGQWLKGPEHPTAWMEYYQNIFERDPEKTGVTREQFEELLK